jgi:PiT family inorganic phosphate transporter
MLMMCALIFGLFLAYANGTNDNFKGVATLYGSKTTTYKAALTWATIAQILGSLTALILAQGLLAAFSGKGLVPDSVVALKSFALAVGLGAAITVMLATRLGFPISTTHALTGALVGAGMLASSEGVDFGKLGTNFFAPLIMSPLLAIAFSALIYLILSFFRKRLNVTKQTCICIGKEVVSVVPAGVTPGAAMAQYTQSLAPSMTIANEAVCVERYSGHVIGINARTAMDTLHYASGGVVCFARALNDTPKIAATLLIGGAFMPPIAIAAVAVAMALGGLLNSRKIAETMSHKVTAMNAGQGFAANLVTSMLVLFASKFGMPVSTTHVSVGSLFGIGAITKQANPRAVVGIVLSWIITLPLAAALSAILFLALRNFV